VLASLLATAKQQGMAPLAYLREVLLAKEGRLPLPFERFPQWANPSRTIAKHVPIPRTWIREEPFFRSSSSESPLTSLSWDFTEAGSCPKGRFRVSGFEKPRRHLTRFTEPGRI